MGNDTFARVIITYPTSRIEDLITFTWEMHGRQKLGTGYRLTGARNLGNDNPFVEPRDFSHAKGCVERVHMAYKDGFVELLFEREV